MTLLTRMTGMTDLAGLTMLVVLSTMPALSPPLIGSTRSPNHLQGAPYV